MPATAAASDAIQAGPAGPVGLERLFVDHQDRVFRAAYRVTGSASDAEDVLQTVFLRLARWDEAALPADNLGSYLHRSAVNAALDLLRARRRAGTVELERADAVAAPDGPESPERARAIAEIRALMRQALAGVNERHAEIFVLRYLEGFGNHEIARLLGVSRVTVAVVLHRVRHRLRRELRHMTGARR